MKDDYYFRYIENGDDILRVSAEPDENADCDSAREGADLTHMFCMHHRYDIGDPPEVLGYGDPGGMKIRMVTELGITTGAMKAHLTESGRGAAGHPYLEYDKRVWKLFDGGNEWPYASAAKIDELHDDMAAILSLDEIEALSGKRLVYRAIYLLDHGGLSIRTSAFGDPWDSGQIGVIWTTTDRVAGNYPEGIPQDELRKNAEKMLEDEVALYNCYLTGDVYKIKVEKYNPALGDPYCECAWETEVAYGNFPALPGEDPAEEAAKDYGDPGLTWSAAKKAQRQREEWLGKERDSFVSDAGQNWMLVSGVEPEPGTYNVLRRAGNLLRPAKSVFANGLWKDPATGSAVSDVLCWQA